MVKAGALYYAVFISFIIALILGSLLLYFYYQHQYINAEILKTRIRDNIESGINMTLADPKKFPYNQPQIINLFDDEKSTVKIERKHWGALDVVKVSSQIKRFRSERLALLGEYIFNTENLALYLCDLNKYLSISGDSRIKGNSKLPRLGIKQAYIEGEGYTGDQLIYGSIKNSEAQLPPINKELVSHNQKYFGDIDSFSDSIVFAGKVLTKKTIQNSFFSKTLILYSEKPVIIQAQHISGNVIIISEASIKIRRNARLEDVLLYSPRINVESGFSGNIQMFAQKKISVGERCNLKYPSFVALLSTSNDSEVSVEISQNTTIYGGVILMGNNIEKSRLNLAKNAHVYGQVYCKGEMEHKGDITGSLYCKRLVLKTKSTLYENHLLDATINFNKLSLEYAGFDIIQKTDEKRIIKWLD
jgi:hypothetical protein